MVSTQSLMIGRLCRWWEVALDDMPSLVQDDVAIIECGLVRGKSPGVKSFFMTSAGIDPGWKTMRMTPILGSVAKLKDLIESVQAISLDQRERGGSDTRIRYIYSQAPSI
jgi:hypothetical protein